MADDNQSTDYERGYHDGVVAASTAVAEFYQNLRVEDARIVADIGAAQEVMHKMLLSRLAPLQDRVRGLKP